MKRILAGIVGAAILMAGNLLTEPQQVKAGTCDIKTGSYNDGLCVLAKNNAQALNCVAGYEYYSCNQEQYNPEKWSYCYGCHASGGGIEPPSTGGCPPGKKQQSFYSCDRKVDGCTAGSNKCTGSGCAKCRATEGQCLPSLGLISDCKIDSIAQLA